LADAATAQAALAPQKAPAKLKTQTNSNPPPASIDAGSVAVDYTLTATATPGAGSYYLSGAVFINNVQPGILNVARLIVQLSSGQQAYPTCALTSPYVASDGLVWGGVNAGGSITTMPLAGSGVIGTGMAGAFGAVGTVLGSWTQFVVPEFSSATCNFNISLGNQVGLVLVFG
jgi:hypothetical protein